MAVSLPFFSLHLDKLWNKSGGPQLPAAYAEIESAHDRLQKRLGKGDVGFFDWPVEIPAEGLAEMKTLATSLRREYEGALILGIGGSYLGPAAIVEALRPAKDQAEFPLYWCSNVDPAEIRRLDGEIRNKRLATVVISKSGNTVETMAGFFHFSKRLDPRGYVVITDPAKGELRRMAVDQAWKALDLPPNIGGRFSVLTAVGLLPTLLAGLNADDLLLGAQKMRAYLRGTKPKENPAYLLAAAYHAWDQKHGCHTQYLMPYQRNLALLADWYVQLWGESIGKMRRSDKKAVGFAPVGALGTTDQHSLLQLFKEGPRDKVVGFMEVLDLATTTVIGSPPFDSGSLDYLTNHSFEEITHFASIATENSLENSGVPTYRIEIPQLSEKALGAFFLFYQYACAFAGELYDVEAFDQPGVEESKKLLRQSL